MAKPEKSFLLRDKFQIVRNFGCSKHHACSKTLTIGVPRTARFDGGYHRNDRYVQILVTFLILFNALKSN